MSCEELVDHLAALGKENMDAVGSVIPNEAMLPDPEAMKTVEVLPQGNGVDSGQGKARWQASTRSWM